MSAVRGYAEVAAAWAVAGDGIQDEDAYVEAVLHAGNEMRDLLAGVAATLPEGVTVEQVVAVYNAVHSDGPLTVVPRGPGPTHIVRATLEALRQVRPSPSPKETT